jgi:hypothetical protein
MGKQRKHYTPEGKVSILPRHLVEKVPVSKICEEQKLQLTVFYLVGVFFRLFLKSSMASASIS